MKTLKFIPYAIFLNTFFLLGLLLFAGKASAQYTNYETKVITDSGVVRGILQKVTEEGLAIADHNGKYTIIRAGNIVKIKVHKKGLTLGTATATGAGLGIGLGSAIFFGDSGAGLGLGEKVAATAIIGGVGAVGGLAGGAAAAALNLRVVLLIDNDAARYRKNFKKLERYSKEHYMGPQTASVNP